MTQTTQSYLEGTGEFQEQLADLSAATGKVVRIQHGSVLALHYRVMRAYYDFHGSDFRNADVVLPELVAELRTLDEKGYVASAPVHIQAAIKNVIQRCETGKDVRGLRLEAALEALMDYAGLMAAPVEAANDPLPNLKKAA